MEAQPHSRGNHTPHSLRTPAPRRVLSYDDEVTAAMPASVPAQPSRSFSRQQQPLLQSHRPQLWRAHQPQVQEQLIQHPRQIWQHPQLQAQLWQHQPQEQLWQYQSPQQPQHPCPPALENEGAVIDVQALQQRAESESGLVLFTMKRQKRRDVWHFARLIRSEACRHIERNDLKNDHAELAYCLLCSAKVKFRVGQSKLPLHMEMYHSEELKAYNTKAEQRNQSTGQVAFHGFSTGKRQMLRTISAEQQKRVNLLLAEWIARHFRPIKIVEDAGFIVFIRYIL
ncbi:hypothetical protein DVH05_006353 [Phytophthora capsici]|nr:hypothetical protein DVH05_006353 [Phytophthora capsici]